jgi:hypothetical protein
LKKEVAEIGELDVIENQITLCLDEKVNNSEFFDAECIISKCEVFNDKNLYEE